MNDKDTEYLMDAEEDGGSTCCGATVYMGICSDCGEHCGTEDEEVD